MPKYEYACKSCGERTEVKQSFEDDALTVCTTCGGPLRRVFSSPGIVLRGPGFYRTDHRSPYRPDGVRPAEKDKESADSKSSSGSKSSESKSGSSDSSGSSDTKSSGSGDKGSGDRGSGDSKGSRESRESSSESRSSGSPGDSGGSKDAARTA